MAPPAEAPPLHEPSSHVPLPVTPAPRARTVLTPAAPVGTAPVAPAPAVGVPEPAVPEAAPEPLAIADDVDAQSARWLAAANAVEPGCLLEGRDPPDLPLPAPAVLARVLTSQPQALAGVAREALVCILDLPKLTQAQVSGATAFRPQAAAAELKLAGGERPLGVLVLAAGTDEPKAEGTLVLALDERDEGWTVCSGLWLPWAGDPHSRKIESLRGLGVLSARRDALVIRQGDKNAMTEEIVGLGVTDDLSLALAVPVAGLDADGSPYSAKLAVRGKAWPRDVVHRAVVTPRGAPKRWRITRYAARPGQPYAEAQAAEGEASLGGAAAALDAGLSDDVEWVVGLLTREQRASSAAWTLRARAAVAAGRGGVAEKAWRGAAEAADAAPEAQRDYGLFLVERRQNKRARAALGKYLELKPDAGDRADVEARIQGLGGHE